MNRRMIQNNKLAIGRRRIYAGKRQNELAESIVFIESIRLLHKTRPNDFPDLNYLYHIPNGGIRNAATANLLRKSGVIAGIPDYFLPVARKGFHGLFIEFKQKALEGKKCLTPSQEKVIPILKRNGYCCQIAFGSDHGIQIIKDYYEANY